MYYSTQKELKQHTLKVLHHFINITDPLLIKQFATPYSDNTEALQGDIIIH